MIRRKEENQACRTHRLRLCKLSWHMKICLRLQLLSRLWIDILDVEETNHCSDIVHRGGIYGSMLSDEGGSMNLERSEGDQMQSEGKHRNLHQQQQSKATYRRSNIPSTSQAHQCAIPLHLGMRSPQDGRFPWHPKQGEHCRCLHKSVTNGGLPEDQNLDGGYGEQGGVIVFALRRSDSLCVEEECCDGWEQRTTIPEIGDRNRARGIQCARLFSLLPVIHHGVLGIDLTYIYLYGV